MLKSNRTAPHGHLTLFLGPMFARKTSSMTNAVERYHLAKRKCLIIKHTLDTRYDHLMKNGGIVTHAGHEYSAVPVKQVAQLANVNVDGYEVIGVDELQFFEDMALVNMWADQGKIVFGAALDGNFKTEPFESPDNHLKITDLIPKAEDVIKLHAVCMQCGDDAAFTVRIGPPISGTLDVGGKDKWLAVCRKCKREK